MSSIPGSSGSTPPNLADLFQRYLRQQVSAETAGLGFAQIDGDVTPYEAVPAQPVEPRLAWSESLLVLQQFGSAPAITVPPEWPNLVAQQDSCAALTFSAGNYPQRVRNLQPLLEAKQLSELRLRKGRALDLDALAEWTRQTASKDRFPHMLLALGLLRSSRQLEAAQVLVEQPRRVPEEWQAAWQNERASLCWEQGDAEKAAGMWNEQADSAGVIFNRGLAALFLDRPVDARAPLTEAVRGLPERSGWHHLARLYLALAEMRAS